MKKLRLNLSKMKGTEILTRDQLKKVLGGYGGSGYASCSATCNKGTRSEYTISVPCDGQCTAQDNSGVTCNDPVKEQRC